MAWSERVKTASVSTVGQPRATGREPESRGSPNQQVRPGWSAKNAGGGTALQVSGKAIFDRSGKATIAFPNKSATVPVPGGLSTSSLALAVLQSVLSGVYVTATTLNVAAKTLTVYLNKAPGTATRPKSVGRQLVRREPGETTAANILHATAANGKPRVAQVRRMIPSVLDPFP